MTNLTELLKKIQRPEVSHVSRTRQTGCGTLQWFLENERSTHPIHNHNHLKFLMGGEEGFASIDKDIRAATQTVDLTLWGFDPGMELVRPAQGGGPPLLWPRATTFGDLLVQKAAGGVKVRLLLWYDVVLSNLGANNVTDLPLVWLEGLPVHSGVVAPSQEWLAMNNLNHSRLQNRSAYCRAWWRAALRGGFANLEVRMRKGDIPAIQANIAAYLPDRLTLPEALALNRGATHHQKPVLIDYAATPVGAKPVTTCGYVMGLNSVTDYWDTTAHGFNDSRRETSAAQLLASDRTWHRKPYRDYAIRIEGEALYNLNENFVQGWDNARRPSTSLDPANVSLQAQRHAIEPKHISCTAGASQRAQIVRTLPERQDASILKAYTLAASNALNYIYVENQYFQLADWPRLIKQMRSQYGEGMKKAGLHLRDAAPLHLFVVMPQAERDEMVPCTYDTLSELNAGDGIGAYHQKVQGVRQGALLPTPEMRGHGPHAKADYRRRLIEWSAQSHSADKSPIVQDSLRAVPVNPLAELQALGIKPLVAMLMSFDTQGQAKNIRINARDNAAQAAQAELEIKANPRGLADDVDDYGIDIIPKPYREIYIHSKLLMVDDVYTMLGSANLNARSMVSDSELNISVAEYDFTQAARKRVWANIAGADLDGGDGGFLAIAQTHDDWRKRMEVNRKARQPGRSPQSNSFIHPFEDPRGEPLVRLQ